MTRPAGRAAMRFFNTIANPIYAEVVPRELTWVAQEEFEHDTAWYVDADGGLDARARAGGSIRS